MQKVLVESSINSNHVCALSTSLSIADTYLDSERFFKYIFCRLLYSFNLLQLMLFDWTDYLAYKKKTI